MNLSTHCCFFTNFTPTTPVLPSVAGLELFGEPKKVVGFLAVDGFGGTAGAPLGVLLAAPLATLPGTTGVAAGIARLGASNRECPTFADAEPSFLCGAESDLERLDDLTVD